MSGFDTELLRRIEADLDDAIQGEVAPLVEGKARDFADYQGRCGRIRGLGKARTIAQEARRALLGDEEGED